MADNATPPKVFISYSRTSEEHRDWVIKLAERLMGDGVHVVADFWDLQPGHDLNTFMEQMVHDTTISKVLAVCDERYMQKANARKGGVGTEALIISQRVYEDVGQEKFIPIAVSKDEEGRLHFPVFFESRYGFDFSDPDNCGEKYDELLRNLLNRPVRKRPPLGTPPADLMSDTPSPVKAAGRLVRFREAIERGKPNLAVYVGGYLETFADNLEDFRLIPANGTTVEQFRAMLLESINTFLPSKNNFLDFTLLLADHLHTNEESLDHIHTFFERLLAMTDWPPHMASWNDHWADNYCFIARELFLSVLATLVGRKRYQVVARILNDQYVVGSRRLGEAITYSAYSFDHCVECLDNPRFRGANGHGLPTTATLTRDRATHPRVNAQDLFQMDFLLYMAPFLAGGTTSNWYPRLFSLSHSMAPLDLFARATSPRGIEPFKTMFGITSLDQLYGRVTAFCTDTGVKHFLQSGSFWRADLNKLLNMEAIHRAAKK